MLTTLLQVIVVCLVFVCGREKIVTQLPDALCAPWLMNFCCIGCILPIAFKHGFELAPLTPILFNRFGLLFCSVVGNERKKKHLALVFY